MVVSQMEINKPDEKWIENTRQENPDPAGLAKHHERYLKFYDPTLDIADLTVRIIAAEATYGAFLANVRATDKVRGRGVSLKTIGVYTDPHVTEDEWLRLVGKFTNNSFEDDDLFLLWDNATAIVVFLTDKTRFKRDDARLLLAWTVLRKLVIYTSAASMKSLQEDHIETFCMKTVSGVLDWALSSRYVSTYTPPKAFSAAKALALNMLEALKHKMRNTPWIVPPVRTMTATKADTMRLIMAYPNYLENATELEKFYAAFPQVGAGFVIGHEVMHAFDVYSIQFNDEAQQVHFGNTPTMKEYERKVLCLRQSYET
ncbi:hypothetical protein MTO96_035787, partial [Rhipicephalus appendiculatus]